MKRLSVSDLEAMTPYELAELLANIVLILRRMPSDVALKDLQPVEKPAIDASKIAAGVRHQDEAKKLEDLPAWVDASEE